MNDFVTVALVSCDSSIRLTFKYYEWRSLFRAYIVKCRNFDNNDRYRAFIQSDTSSQVKRISADDGWRRRWIPFASESSMTSGISKIHRLVAHSSNALSILYFWFYRNSDWSMRLINCKPTETLNCPADGKMEEDKCWIGSIHPVRIGCNDRLLLPV